MSTTIDAAIIKALVEHVGGDSSNIGSGSIGGQTYTAGTAIDISNNSISVKYDTNTMELKNGKLAAKQSTSGGSSTVADETWDTVDWSSMESSGLFTPNVVTIDGTDYIGLSYNDTGSPTIPRNFGIRLYFSRKDTTDIYQMIMLPYSENAVAIGQGNQNGYRSYVMFTFNSYRDNNTSKDYYYCQWMTADKYDINSFRINNDVHFTTFTQQICLKYILEKITQ